MMNVWKLILITSFGALLAQSGFAATDELILDTSGRTISMPQTIGKEVQVVVRGVLGDCESLDLYYEAASLQTALDEISALPQMPSGSTEEKSFRQSVRKAETGCMRDKTILIEEKSLNVPVGNGKALNYFLVRTRMNPPKPPTVSPNREALDSSVEVVASRSTEVKVISDEIKNYSGMSSEGAAAGVKTLIEKLDVAQKALDIANRDRDTKQKVFDKATAVYEESLEKSKQIVVLRVGVLLVTKSSLSKPVYYRFVTSKNEESPFRLEHIGYFPVFNVHNDLYLIIVNHKKNEVPSDFVLSLGTEKGAVVDIAPVRPTIDQSVVSIRTEEAPSPAPSIPDFSNAYVDRVLPFPDKIPGETVPLVTVSSYAEVVTANKKETTDGSTTTTKTTETKTVKILDSERWPQVHSLFYFNLSTGVIATWLQDPTYSRVLTDLAVPKTATSDEIPAKYATSVDNGSARAMPILAFSAYLLPMDIQVPWRLRDLTPAPTVGFSLSSPKDDFFFGASSEIRRNVQLLYGYHYGRITVLGPAGIDDPTSSAPPATTSRFKGDFFAGLTFNLNFIKELFK